MDQVLKPFFLIPFTIDLKAVIRKLPGNSGKSPDQQLMILIFIPGKAV